MRKDKYALLDTDFISKTHMIQKDADNHLIDRIMELPNYRFFCHSQIRIELSRHNASKAVEWLEDKISKGKVKCYSDEDILKKLMPVYGAMTMGLYVNLLQRACQAYAEGYYEKYFRELQKVDYGRIAKNVFLKKLKTDCDSIDSGNNLGEIKTYVLLQMLSLVQGEQIYVFCSDDQNASRGIVSIGEARCMSVLSAFVHLKRECGLEQKEAEAYVRSWLDFCAAHKQTKFRIQENFRGLRMRRIPCEQVMREIYEDKFEETRIGYLRYRSE